MKLRIKGNSLRIRVSQTEIKRFAEQGSVEESVDFGPGGQLRYRLEIDPHGARINADFDRNIITVWLPRSAARQWCDTDQVSLQGEQPLTAGVLKLLVEKDFRCLVPREGEDESDLFDHPRAGGG